MQTKREERDAGRQFGRDQCGRSGATRFSQVGLEIDGPHLLEAFAQQGGQFPVVVRAAHQQAVVVHIDDQAADDALQDAEVDHHAVFRVGGIVAGGARHGDEQPVGVAVDFRGTARRSPSSTCAISNENSLVTLM